MGNTTRNRSLLRVEHLNVHYRTRRGLVKAVRNVNFELGPRENLAVIGESESGKSTLGLALVGLLPRSAEFTANQLVYFGTHRPLDLSSCGEENMRQWRWQEVAIVFQAALSAFNPVLSIFDQFVDTARAHGLRDRSEIRRRALELLELVQLDPKRVLDAYSHELSGGMRQRVLIALALLLEPKVLILDEPTTALDILTQRIVIELLRKLKEELDLAMVLISHDLSLAAELADRVATMYAGQFVEHGSVHRVFYSAQHPYSRGLIGGVPRVQGSVQDLTSIPGSPPDLIDLPSGCKFHERCQYATQLCRRKEPVMELVDTVGVGHAVACLRWRKINEAASGDRAQEDN
ncbi:MAG: ABC transporter ATP-binding protein [Firmicutes bacterium]|nr:ABC transporter ATP-binding protein [Bacillota bacterium]